MNIKSNLIAWGVKYISIYPRVSKTSNGKTKLRLLSNIKYKRTIK